MEEKGMGQLGHYEEKMELETQVCHVWLTPPPRAMGEVPALDATEGHVYICGYIVAGIVANVQGARKLCPLLAIALRKVGLMSCLTSTVELALITGV